MFIWRNALDPSKVWYSLGRADRIIDCYASRITALVPCFKYTQ